MEGDALIFAQVMTVIVISLAGFVGIGLGARILWRLGSRPPRRIPGPADLGEQKRLETAVESIAIEVERISESQRYMVALLAKRSPGDADDGVKELPAAGASRRANVPD